MDGNRNGFSRLRGVSLAVACAFAAMSCVHVERPAREELVGSWHVTLRQPGSPPATPTIEFRADGSCAAEPGFVTFVAQCNGKSPTDTAEDCRWAVEPGAKSDEIQVVLASKGGFLALRMAAERLIGPGVLRLQGLCVDRSRYWLSP